MIKTTDDKLVTEVYFGKEQAAVSFMANGHKFIVQQLKPGVVLKIGDQVDDLTKIQDLPKVVLNFYDIESVNAMIKVLERVKHNIEYPYGTYAYAC